LNKFTVREALAEDHSVGPILLGHFGFIHLFSILVLYCVSTAYFAARTGRTKSHRGNVLGVYIGGILIAGGFAFMPGRLFHTWLIAYTAT